MMNWVVVEVKSDGSKRLLDGEYLAHEDACDVQEAMEWLHDENGYLVYTADEWMHEVESGRAMPS